MLLSASITDLIQIVENIAPPGLALPDDRIGLQVGDRRAVLTGVVVALDPCAAVVDRALSIEANAVVTHHALIRTPLGRVVPDDPAGRLVLRVLRSGLAWYVAHTNLDRAPRGVSAVLAEVLGLQNAEPLWLNEPCAQFKLVVFVPKGYEDKVREAACSAGAGVIGGYTFCAFQTEGVGTFLPSGEARPFSGEVGKLSRADELRLEMLVSAPVVSRVIEAVKRAHPYEEVAYDLLVTAQDDRRFSSGRIGELQTGLSLEEFAVNVKKALRLDSVRVVGDGQKQVRRVATVAGGGAKFVSAAADAGADVFVTGDVGHHHALDAMARGVCLIDAGHAGTEQVILEPLARTLRAELTKLDPETNVEAVLRPTMFAHV